MTAPDPAERTNVVQIAVGVCVTALGILLLLHKLDMIALEEIVRLWPVALVLLGGAMIWQARRGGPATPCVSVGSVVWIILLGMLLSHVFDRRGQPGDVGQEGTVNLFAVMSADRRPITNHFRGGQTTAVMGRTDIDLREASMAPGENAILDVFMVMGGGTIRVPEHWRVEIDAMPVMGGVKDQRDRRGGTSGTAWNDSPAAAEIPSEPQVAEPPRLIVRGIVIMSGLSIRH